MTELMTQNDILAGALQPPRIPRATYRIQFNAGFTFADAQKVLDYLQALGISDLYASPLFQPRTGSTHGYDVVDYNAFNPVLGGEAGFEALSGALRSRGLGLLLDIVPNHMGVSTENVWWQDVLKHGPSSAYARYFDIDWRPANRNLDDKLLIPVLGDHSGRVLEAGELKVVYWHGDFYMHYYEGQYPLTPESYVDILTLVQEHLRAEDDEAWAALELASVLRSVLAIPAYTSTGLSALDARWTEMTVLRWRLLGLFDKSVAFREALGWALNELNGTSDDPASFDRLDALIGRQPYRLAYWRTATDEINYRRFFDINDLAAVRSEDPQVFADQHRLTLRLLAEGKVSGLRVDHPDGLYNPPAYFRQLQEAYVLARMQVLGAAPVENPVMAMQQLDALAKQDSQPPSWPLFVLVEKILSRTEPLPYSWAVYGTTGYDFMNEVNALFVDPGGEAKFDALYRAFTGNDEPLDVLVQRMKKLIMRESLASELDARSAQLKRIVEGNRRYRGFTQNSLAFAMSEIIAAMPIYRTYISGPGDISERDRFYIESAAAEAKARNPLTPASVFEFLEDTLLLENLGDFTEDQRGDLREFVMKFQQITGPIMAKSVEDTAFYVYNRLVSLNEVGGHPDHFGTTVDDFHTYNGDKPFPHTMLAGSTHDTKRSEDVRARLNVLSEMPDDWEQAIQAWSAINAAARTDLNGTPAPAPNDEYLLYQALIGVYQGNPADPALRQRLAAYMQKAINEAKVHSNWVNQNMQYADAVTRFIGAMLDNPAFVAAFEPFHKRVSHFGKVNALAQLTLRLTSPGMPDIYQGQELWDFSLVDPDNRRPVDYGLRVKMLADLKSREADRLALAAFLLDDMDSGAAKLYVTARTLTYRREHDALFTEGGYQAIPVVGERADHVVAFARLHEGRAVVTVVPRLVVGLTGGRDILPLGADVWGDTALDLSEVLATVKSLENLYTGETVTVGVSGAGGRVPLAELFGAFPVALLEAMV